MTSLMRVCGVAASVLILTMCSTGVAGAEPTSQPISDSALPATITLQISPGSTARTTTVTVEVHPSAAGQPTEIRVATDSDPLTPTILGAAIGTTSVKSVSVDMQHPLDLNLGASAPAATGATMATGCGPHPPADMPGCSGRQDTHPAQQPAAASVPAVVATPAAAAGQPAPEVAGQQATPSPAAAVTVTQAVTSPPQAGSAPAAGQAPASPQAPPTAGGIASAPLTYTVQPGDTLRGVAMRFYGDSNAFDRIVGTNAGRVMNDGRMFDQPSLIQPGWVLVIPEPTSVITDQTGTRVYTVQPGDTLVGIAAQLLGDAERWPELAATNEETQPQGGRALTGNPDLIWPGMQLRLPARYDASALAAAEGFAAAEALP